MDEKRTRICGPGADDARSVSDAIARAKQGDREAFRFLYDCYADVVYGLVVGIVRDDKEAEDITQNVFMKLMTKLQQYEERDCPFVAWLRRVSRNMAVDHVRQMRQTPCAEVFGSDRRADDVPGDRARALRDALSTLPSTQREVLVLRHLAGMTPGEIAERLQRSEPSIHGLHNRGRTALQKALTALDSAPMVVPAARVAATLTAS
jgi:RNA polymerase sigma-70 factor, ECF subfamily